MDASTKFRLEMIEDAMKQNQAPEDAEYLAKLVAMKEEIEAGHGGISKPSQDVGELEQRPVRRDSGTDRGSRTSQGNPASDAQYRYIAKLRSERDTSAAYRQGYVGMMAILLERTDNETLAKRDASELIDWLRDQPLADVAVATAVNGGTTPLANDATERQMGFIASLCGERGLPVPTGLTKAQASQLITELLATPKPARRPATAPAASQVTEDGMYRKDGEIYKVQIAHHGSGKLYAKKLTKLDEPRELKNGTRTHEFVYAPGAINQLRPEHKLTLEQAKEFGALYGTCICGAVLTNEKSIAEGIGPICAKKF